MPRGRTSKEIEGYQELVCNTLQGIFGETDVKKEWNVAKDSKDDFTRELYCPRLDVAVGPFNIDRDIERNKSAIKTLAHIHRDFIDRMLRYSQQQGNNVESFLENANPNPRCFLAIEIENSGSSKHMLGNIANVSIIGSIGVVIPFNYKKASLCNRIKKYVTFATQVGKTEDVFKNVLIIDKENFLRVLEGIRRRR